MMRILSIDPGTDETAWLIWDGRIVTFGFQSNSDFLSNIRGGGMTYHAVAIEMIASYGMPVGREVFETCVHIGRIIEAVRAYNPEATWKVYRKDVKLHLCGTPRAKDGNIRQALIDRIGKQGTKKEPGPTYGVSKHVWAALAVAVYAHDMRHTAKGNDTI